MPISVKKIFNAVSSSAIYEKTATKKGVLYRYFPQNDILAQQLDTLAQQYRQTQTIPLKTQLLDKEREILYQELENPHLTIVRNSKDVFPKYGKQMGNNRFMQWIQSLNITGLRRIEVLEGPFKPKITKKRIDLLHKAYGFMQEDNKFGRNARLDIIDLLERWHASASKPEKQHILTVLKDMQKTTQNKNLKAQLNSTILSLNFEPFGQKLYTDLRANPNQPKKLSAFLQALNKTSSDKTSIKELKTKTAEFVTDLLTQPKISPEIRQIAVWGAGAFKSEKSFEIIKHIAENSKNKNIRLRELAIHSTTMYVKQKPDEVGEILTGIEKEKSVFSPLATILKDKIKGNYHGQKNREYHYHHLSAPQIEQYENGIKKFVKLDETSLNIQSKNALDRSLLFFRGIFDKFKDKKLRCFISKDTVTKHHPQDAGKRSIVWNSLNYGEFDDSIDAVNHAEDFRIISMDDIFRTPSQSNMLGHEVGHSLQELLTSEENEQLAQIYKSSLKRHKPLGIYASYSPDEYFAQGCEAMISVYKPHSKIIEANNDNINTRYLLMAKDRKMFDFIQQVVQKYSKK